MQNRPRAGWLLTYAVASVRRAERSIERTAGGGGRMQSRLRTRIAVGVCCLALATIPLSSFTAGAHTQTFKATLTIRFDQKTQTFEGHVGTSVFCQEDRLVSVYETDGSLTLVGTALSTHGGQWGDVSWDGPGTYFAQVSEVHLGGYGDDHTCLAAESATITVT
jgi:hypothetical protein